VTGGQGRALFTSEPVRIVDIKGATARACLNILGGDVEFELGVDLLANARAPTD
jgi:hypothetical protein